MTRSLELQIANEAEFAGGLAAALRQLEADAMEAIEGLGDDAADLMRQRAAPDRELAGSVKVEKGVDFVEVGSTHPHGVWREYGTGVFGPGHRPIVPKRKQALAGGLGHPVEQVAGMRPHPWFRSSLNLALRRFKGWLR